MTAATFGVFVMFAISSRSGSLVEAVAVAFAVEGVRRTLVRSITNTTAAVMCGISSVSPAVEEEEAEAERRIMPRLQLQLAALRSIRTLARSIICNITAAVMFAIISSSSSVGKKAEAEEEEIEERATLVPPNHPPWRRAWSQQQQ